MRTATLIENFELLAFGMVQTVAWEESGKQRVFFEDSKKILNLCSRKSSPN